MSAAYPASAPTRPMPAIRVAVVPAPVRYRRRPVEVFGLIVCVFLLLGTGVVLALGAVALVLGGAL